MKIGFPQNITSKLAGYAPDWSNSIFQRIYTRKTDKLTGLWWISPPGENFLNKKFYLKIWNLNWGSHVVAHFWSFLPFGIEQWILARTHINNFWMPTSVYYHWILHYKWWRNQCNSEVIGTSHTSSTDVARRVWRSDKRTQNLKTHTNILLAPK